MDFKKSSIFLGLVASSTLAFSAPAEAAVISFGTGGIEFDTDTVVDFEFILSNGSFQSGFGIADAEGNILTTLFSENAPGFDDPAHDDFVGTPGITVTDPTASFTFLAGQEYSFFLTTEIAPGVVFSTTELNAPTTVQAQFTGDVATGAEVAFDDRGAGDDKDFNDFRVRAQVADVPEPTTLAGLGLAAASLAFLRRRQSKPIA